MIDDQSTPNPPTTIDGTSTRLTDDQIGKSATGLWPRVAKAALDDETFANIIADIAAGEPAYKAVPANGINPRVFWSALRTDDARAKEYERAHVAGIERLAQEILEISDTSQIGEKRKTVLLSGVQGEGENKVKVTLPAEEVTTGDMVEARKLQVESRKWLLSKLLPKKYGDRVAVEHTVGEAMLTAIREARERGRLINPKE